LLEFFPVSKLVMNPKAFSTHPDFGVDIALTARCLLSCRYCTVVKEPTPELAPGQWKKIILSLAKLRTIGSVSLEGGEPFLYEDLDSVLESSLQLSRAVKIVTSGTLPCQLPDSLVLSSHFHFEISLDGPAPIHNFLRARSYPQALNFLMDCLRRGIRVRFRSVISRHNLPFYENWLLEMDRSLEEVPEKIGFFFDVIIAPRPLFGVGGFVGRAAIREYPVDNLIPSPFEIGTLFRKIKGRTFRNLEFLQEEPLRGCQAARCLSLSFDPAGIYSYCCESPNGFGSILDHAAETCLSFLEEFGQNSPCRDCPHFANRTCMGCWTGQKCGLVGHWGFAGCRELLSCTVQGIYSLDQEKKRVLSGSKGAEI
jgi:hypothetical protein